MPQKNAVVPVEEIKSNIEKMKPDFQRALQERISADKFVRVAQTVMLTQPELANAERTSLYAACMQAAQDGLLPDGREAAFVVFKGKVVYMSMVYGLKKKVRAASPDIAKWNIRIIKENDEFDYEEGDNDKIYHKPNIFAARGETVGAYSIVTYRNGDKDREVMSIEEIEYIRRTFSRSPDSPAWTKSYDEMCKKTVCRRHCKNLPMDEVTRTEIVEDPDFVKPTVDAPPEKKVSEKKPKKAEPTSSRLADAVKEKNGAVSETPI